MSAPTADRGVGNQSWDDAAAEWHCTNCGAEYVQGFTGDGCLDCGGPLIGRAGEERAGSGASAAPIIRKAPDKDHLALGFLAGVMLLGVLMVGWMLRSTLLPGTSLSMNSTCSDWSSASTSAKTHFVKSDAVQSIGFLIADPATLVPKLDQTCRVEPNFKLSVVLNNFGEVSNGPTF